MLDLSDLEKGADANSNGRTAITGIAIVVAMVTSLVLAISYFVPIPVAVGLIAGALWILSLITAIVLAAIQPGGFVAKPQASRKDADQLGSDVRLEPQSSTSEALDLDLRRTANSAAPRTRLRRSELRILKRPTRSDADSY
ncbi:MAG: hypothetical protein V9E85_14405 [Candidatus Nanopelagicales bacterium]